MGENIKSLIYMFTMASITSAKNVIKSVAKLMNKNTARKGENSTNTTPLIPMHLTRSFLDIDKLVLPYVICFGLNSYVLKKLYIDNNLFIIDFSPDL